MKSLCFALISIAVLLGGAVADAQTLTVGSAAASCGTEAQVDVSIGPVSAISSIRFEIGYDSAKLSVSKAPLPGNVSGFFIDYNPNTPGTVVVAMIAGDPVAGPGTVARLRFDVNAGASGSTTISIANGRINGADAAGVSGSLSLSCGSGGGGGGGGGGHTLSAGSVSGACGANVQVPVSIAAGAPFASIGFTVGATPGLTLTGVTAGAKTAGWRVELNDATGAVAMIGSEDATGSGEIAILKFAVGSTASGPLPVSLSGTRVNGQTAAGTNGTVTATCGNGGGGGGGGPQPPNPPSYISPVSESTGIAAPVVLRWQPAAGATTYRVRFGTTDPPPFHNATDRTTLNVATQAGTKYYWSVEAVAAGGTATGPVWQFTTGGVNCVMPDAPYLFAPVIEIASGTPFSLTWSITTGVTEYVLEESADLSFASVTTTTHPSSSATLTLWYSNPTSRYFRVRGRNAASPCSADGPRSNTVTVRIVPSSTGNATPRILAVAGSLAGSAGSYFRTSLQLHNPTAAMMRGRVIFHRQGTAGTSADPSFPYQLAPGATTSWSDVVLAFGSGSGIGSIDLVAHEGEPPLASARIYNDAGANGTTGVAIDAIEQANALKPGRRAHLFAPIDPARARMNIGVRSLGDGATIEFTLRDYSGNFRQVTTRSFGPTWFEQMGLNALFDKPLLGDEVVMIEVRSGSAIVYGSITDNMTQDPTIQFAK